MKTLPISVLEWWIHFGAQRPRLDTQPQSFPEIPQNDELLKQRQPETCGHSVAMRGAMELRGVFYKMCGLK